MATSTVFLTGGSSWQKPAGVTEIIVECWGGGGGSPGAAADGVIVITYEPLLSNMFLMF